MSETLVQYGTSFQSKIIASLLTDTKFTKQIIDILEVNYFDSDSNKFLIKSIKDYFVKYKTNPTMEALKVVIDEKLADNSFDLGNIFREELNIFIKSNNLVTQVRGKGLLNAILINDSPDSSTAWDICMKLKENGLLAKPTHGNIIRLAPPLVINKSQLLECVDIIKDTISNF